MKTLSYLDNLVARNMPETAVIQPRPISLFEPWPGTRLPFSNAMTGEEEAAVRHAEPSPRPQPQSLFPVAEAPNTAVPPPITPPMGAPPAPEKPASLPIPTSPPAAGNQGAGHYLPNVGAPAALPAAPLSAAAVVAQPLKGRLSIDDAATMGKLASPTQPTVTLFPRIQHPTPPPNDHRTEPPSAKEANSTVIIKEQLTLLKSVTEVPAQTAPALVEIVRERPVQPRPSPVSPPPAAHEQPDRASTSPVVIRADQIKPFTPANARPSNPQPQATPPPDSMPTVQITIGRIEVRATPPAPTKVEKRQPQTPVLSLDDYLRQRNGGRS